MNDSKNTITANGDATTTPSKNFLFERMQTHFRDKLVEMNFPSSCVLDYLEPAKQFIRSLSEKERELMTPVMQEKHNIEVLRFNRGLFAFGVAVAMAINMWRTNPSLSEL
jgi:hypothetical protein